MCLTLPEVLVTVMGIEKLLPTWRDLEVFLQLLPRSSTAERMNPYTSMWTGRDAGRRTAGLPPHPARQRPDGRAVGHGRAPGAPLHPLLGLPQRVPGLRADGRPGLRLGLPRPDRGDPDAAAARASPATRSTSRPRRCRSPRRCVAPASRSARSGSTSPRCSSTCAGRPSGTPRRATGCRPAEGCEAWPPPLGVPEPAAARAGGAARRPRRASVRPAGGRLRRIPGPGPIGGWFRARDLRAPARESFRAWWHRTDGGREGWRR